MSGIAGGAGGAGSGSWFAACCRVRNLAALKLSSAVQGAVARRAARAASRLLELRQPQFASGPALACASNTRRHGRESRASGGLYQSRTDVHSETHFDQPRTQQSITQLKHHDEHAEQTLMLHGTAAQMRTSTRGPHGPTVLRPRCSNVCCRVKKVHMRKKVGKHPQRADETRVSRSEHRRESGRGRAFAGHFKLAYSRRDSHHSRAFWNSRSHGPGPLASRPRSEGNQGFCHIRKQRSGCGIMARWRPSGEHSAAMPSGEPLGLKGYCVVGEPSLSQYLHADPGRAEQQGGIKRGRPRSNASRGAHEHPSQANCVPGILFSTS